MPNRDLAKIESAPETSLPDISDGPAKQEGLIRLHSVDYQDELMRFRKRLVEEALKLLGAPSIKYRNPGVGKTPKTGFDCSGFVVYLFGKLYKEFSRLPLQEYPRHSNKFFDRYGIFVPWGRQRPGDLMFIYRQSKGWYVDHMGIMVDHEHYIHAPGKDDTQVQVVRLSRRWRMKNRDPDGHYEFNPVGFKRIALDKGRWRIG